MSTVPQQKETTMPWACPYCFSSKLRVFYSDRRCAPIDQCCTDSPMPVFDDSELVEGAEDIDVWCFSCNAEDVTPILVHADADHAEGA